MSAVRDARPTTAARPVAAIPQALALALGACVSLGLARFSYALLLPPMRDDLGWSYFMAGAMNTVNAAGYLAGALLAPRLIARRGARATLLGGMVGTALLLLAHGALRGEAALLAARLASGVASAFVFMAGGLLAARLGGTPGAAGTSAGLVLGIYYGGTGLGIVASAWLVPPITAAARGWPWAWVALGVAALACTAWTARGVPPEHATSSAGGAAGPRAAFAWRRFVPSLAAYLLFGLGYIGYMTFVVTLLREEGLSGALIVAFYTLLGLGVMASSWLWAGLLQRQRGGRALALLNALLALATVLPVLAGNVAAIFASGALFGAVFLSVVASTTALVRHNVEAAAWPAGIAAYTSVFALGQIAGPALVGAIADAAGGLRPGLGVSAAVLAAAALLAWLQKPSHPRDPP
ncbi:MAG TPA: YbfB/YjiJ family MFS transporter [Ideonella sp.]|nr:YbfB/YjiJ family MFS transporter [Ideonella sp.]